MRGLELDPARFEGKIGGKRTGLFRLVNKSGMIVNLCNYGARVLQIITPDRDGKPGDVAWGYDDLYSLAKADDYIGAFVGRYAGRIAEGRFLLNGARYATTVNEGTNTLHGGVKGTKSAVFDCARLSPSAVEMTYTFRDGEEGFPGTLPLRVVYSLTEDNALRIDHWAVAADKPTVANFTNHTFFNLSGELTREILDHVVQIEADAFLPQDKKLIPTGEIRPVEGTPLNFTVPKAILRDIKMDYEQLIIGNGYDHPFVIRNAPTGGELALNAKVLHPGTGRVLEVFSTEPNIQFYTANFNNGAPPFGKNGQPHNFRCAFCFEPQRYPDAPNQPYFPDVTINPGEWRTGSILYKFSAEK